MRCRTQLIQLVLAGIAVLMVAQAAAARPWLSRNVLADSNRLSGVQEQLRANQLRRLKDVSKMNEVATDQTATADSGVSLGYGYGSYGPSGGYGESLEGSARGSLLAPAVSYLADVQAVVQAGAAWDPSAASIELSESGQKQTWDSGDDVLLSMSSVKEAGQKAAGQQQFYDEGDEVMVGAVPAVNEAGQKASSTKQFYEEGDELLRGPVPTRV